MVCTIIADMKCQEDREMERGKPCDRAGASSLVSSSYVYSWYLGVFRVRVHIARVFVCVLVSSCKTYPFLSVFIASTQRFEGADRGITRSRVHPLDCKSAPTPPLGPLLRVHSTIFAIVSRPDRDPGRSRGGTQAHELRPLRWDEDGNVLP